MNKIRETTYADAGVHVNLGQGMIIITPEPDKVMEAADKYSIESKIVGSITSERIIKIKSKGFHSEGKRLEFRI